MENKTSSRVGGAFALIALLSMTPAVHAVPVRYEFTTDVGGGIAGWQIFGFETFQSLSVSGSFVYDGEGALIGAAGNATTYGGFSSLAGTVGDYSFADNVGIVHLTNDHLAVSPVPVPSDDIFVDILTLSSNVPALEPGIDDSLQGFDLNLMTLISVRLQWTEVVLGGTPDFITAPVDSPSLLPEFAGSLWLEFAPVDPQLPVGNTRVRFSGLTARPVSVPEPESVSLLALGLLGIALVRRRKRIE